MEMFERFKIYSSFLPTLQILFLLLDLLNLYVDFCDWDDQFSKS